MRVSEALQCRQSTRAFLPTAVEHDKIERILRAARQAPSGVNAQPWQVAVLNGAAKRALQAKFEAAFRAGEKPQMDYQYYPLTWEEPYKSRRKACGLQLYTSLNIAREDRERQRDQWAANYRAFDAPVMLLFFMDPVLQAGSYIDYGMFLQSIMLMAVEEGLATCPQAALGEYPRIVKEQLGYAPDCVLMGGMALGYPDTAAPVNQFRTAREELSGFVRFFE